MKTLSWRFALGFLSVTSLTFAHLVDDSLTPKGGETIAAGTKTPIKWEQDVGHNGKYDVEFSKDGGATWTAIEKAWQGPTASGTVTYGDWTPAAGDATTQGRVRVCQYPTGTANCTSPYTLKSAADFTVTSNSSVRPGALAGDPSLSLRADTRNVMVTFGLTAAADVELEVFDAAGRVVATLADGRLEAGSHSLPAAGLDPAGAYVFRLRVGARVVSLPWNRLN